MYLDAVEASVQESVPVPAVHWGAEIFSHGTPRVEGTNSTVSGGVRSRQLTSMQWASTKLNSGHWQADHYCLL